MKCQCQTLFELNGNEALRYARAHLVEVRVDSERWVTHYHCPATGAAWQMDYPQSELHGGGPPRLRKVEKTAGPFTRFRNVYVSDEGFSVKVLGRTGLLYQEGPRQMRVDSEVLLGPSGMAVWGNSISKWQPPHDHEPLDFQKRFTIIDNIRRAFRFDGFDIEVYCPSHWPAGVKQYLPLDSTRDYPAGDDLFYECLRCGDLRHSTARQNHCRCGNIAIAIDGRITIEVKESVKLFAAEER